MKKSESLSTIISAVMALMFISGCSEPRRLGNPNAKIYIDSVPAGAHVYLAPSQDEHTWKDLGITPLVLNHSECPRKEFFIMIEMDEYIKKITTVPTFLS